MTSPEPDAHQRRTRPSPTCRFTLRCCRRSPTSATRSPSAIQAATIPAMLAGSDVVGLAQTGTGKTAAFAIPILSKIDTASRTTQALVLAPTRELALQVAEAFSRYGAHLPGQRAADLRRLHRTARSWPGSSAAPRSSSARRAGSSTTSRSGTLDLSHLDYLVLDEADEMLQMGFAEDVERILAGTPETSRWRCSRRPCRRPSARSPPSTCTTRSRSRSSRRPRPPTTSRSATSRSPGPARWTR